MGIWETTEHAWIRPELSVMMTCFNVKEKYDE